MDRRESDALRWINRSFVEIGLDRVVTEFPKSSLDSPREFPVARLLARGLEVAGLRSPGTMQFDATMATYSYWRGIRYMQGVFPPQVASFNQAFALGQFPLLIA